MVYKIIVIYYSKYYTLRILMKYLVTIYYLLKSYGLMGEQIIMIKCYHKDMFISRIYWYFINIYWLYTKAFIYVFYHKLRNILLGNFACI